MRARKLAGLLSAGGLLLAVAAAPAGADPQGETFVLPCDNGQTYTVVVPEGGNEEHSRNNFTPAHSVDGTTTLVPVAFGEFTVTITDPDGNVSTETEPGATKGSSGKNARDLVTCTITFSGTEDGFTFEGSGTVTGFVTPRRRA